MQGLAVGLRAPSGSRLLGHHVPTLRRSVSVRPLFVLTPLLLVARRSSPLESRDSSMYVQSVVLKSAFEQNLLFVCWTTCLWGSIDATAYNGVRSVLCGR